MLLAVNVVLLRRVLSPLMRLTEAMSSVDPDRPGRRLSGVEPISVEGQAMARAFNAMLDRLEHARHEAARTALAAQEAERLRVARELHDEIGQTLTAVTIQAERAADIHPDPRRRPCVTLPTASETASTRCAASLASCALRPSTTSAS